MGEKTRAWNYIENVITFRGADSEHIQYNNALAFNKGAYLN
jgi:hypothetical protein